MLDNKRRLTMLTTDDFKVLQDVLMLNGRPQMTSTPIGENKVLPSTFLNASPQVSALTSLAQTEAEWNNDQLKAEGSEKYYGGLSRGEMGLSHLACRANRSATTKTASSENEIGVLLPALSGKSA